MLPVAILAGGLAKRLGPVADRVPKSLLELNGEPFIFHQLRLLKAQGVQRVVLCVGYLGKMIRQVVKEGQDFGLEVDYSFDGAALLGTAGAVKNALPKLGKFFFVLYGDSYLVCDYAAVAREFQRAGKLSLMTVFKNEGRWDDSNVEYEAGRILAYSKTNRTPRMLYIDYGLGAFSARAFAGLPAGQASDLAELYGRLLEEGQLGAMEIQHRFYEIGSPAGLEETARFLVAQKAAQSVKHK